MSTLFYDLSEASKLSGFVARNLSDLIVKLIGDVKVAHIPEILFGSSRILRTSISLQNRTLNSIYATMSMQNRRIYAL